MQLVPKKTYPEKGFFFKKLKVGIKPKKESVYL